MELAEKHSSEVSKRPSNVEREPDKNSILVTQPDGPDNHDDLDHLVNPRFGFWALLGYQMMVTASWSNYLVTVGVAVDVGGPVGFLYGTLIVGFFQQLTVLSLSEFAALWPHPGGPAFWIVKLAPDHLGPAFAFFMGWVNVIAYATPLASAGFSSTQVITALITIVYGYEWERWQLCLIFWGISITYLPVSLRPSWLPAWSIAAFVALISFLVVTIGIWTSHIEAQSAEFVFTKFINNTGWSNNGYVFLLSLVQTSFAMSGLEAATHMSFETKNPRRTVPLVLNTSAALSTIICFGFAILTLFALGPFDNLVQSSLGAIYLQLYVNAIGHAGGLAVATIIMIVLNQFCGTQLLAAGSRIVWALARLGWVPYSSAFTRVESSGAPRNATILILALNMLCGLLYVASETAWNAIVSCVVGAFQIAYAAPIIVLLVRGRSVLPSRRAFNLDAFGFHLGYIINVIVVLWSFLIIILSLLPIYSPVTASNMNYCVVVFGICSIFLAIYWFGFLRKHSLAGAENLPDLIH